MGFYIFFVLCLFLLHLIYLKHNKRKFILICGAFYKPERLPVLTMQAAEVKGSAKVDTNGGNDEEEWQELLALREETKLKLYQVKQLLKNSQLKAIHGYKVLGWNEIWDDCDDDIKEMADPAIRDGEFISENLEKLKNLNEELTPIAALFESQTERKTTSSLGDEESTQKASTSKKSRPKTRRVSTLPIQQQAPNHIKLADDETRLPQEQIELYRSAQNMVCDLNRKDAKYGDGSTAIIVIFEQVAGGVGGEPKSIVGNTLHKAKCQQAIVGLRKLGQGLPQDIQDRIQRHINKMQEAIKWAEDYHDRKDPKLPRWAKPYKSQIEKFKEDMN